MAECAETVPPVYHLLIEQVVALTVSLWQFSGPFISVSITALLKSTSVY